MLSKLQVYLRVHKMLLYSNKNIKKVCFFESSEKMQKTECGSYRALLQVRVSNTKMNPQICRLYCSKLHF